MPLGSQRTLGLLAVAGLAATLPGSLYGQLPEQPTAGRSLQSSAYFGRGANSDIRTATLPADGVIPAAALLQENRGDSQPQPPLSGQVTEASPSDVDNQTEGEKSSRKGQSAGVETVPATDQSLAPLQSGPLTIKVNVVDLSTQIIGTGTLPESASAQLEAETMILPDGRARGAAFKCVHWRPSLITHNPLYFQDAMLERHGHVRYGHLQPLSSAVKFYSTFLIYPYLHTLESAHECQYALGQFRPGSCAPVLKDHLPYDRRAAAVETLSVASFLWAMPLNY